MSFWEDASPVVKGAIVVGIIGLIYFGAAYAGSFFPFNPASDEEITQERGLPPPPGQ